MERFYAKADGRFECDLASASMTVGDARFRIVVGTVMFEAT